MLLLLDDFICILAYGKWLLLLLLPGIAGAEVFYRPDALSVTQQIVTKELKVKASI